MNKEIYCMTDIETLDTEPNAIIVSIGAVLFTADGILPNKFYVPITLESCMEKGMNLNLDTLRWWFKQDNEAQKVFYDPNAVQIKQALQMFKDYVYANARTFNVHMCGNSSRFDMGILHQAYLTCGMKSFWKHWQERDYRTWKNIKGVPELKREGQYHNAVDDAYSQALHAIDINNHLGGIIL